MDTSIILVGDMVWDFVYLVEETWLEKIESLPVELRDRFFDLKNALQEHMADIIEEV